MIGQKYSELIEGGGSRWERRSRREEVREKERNLKEGSEWEGGKGREAR